MRIIKLYIYIYAEGSTVQKHLSKVKNLSFARDNVFSPAGGSRSKVKKILIVITDGRSNDFRKVEGAIQSADNKNIVRFAIGVSSIYLYLM